MKILVKRVYREQTWFELEEVSAPTRPRQRSSYRPVTIAGRVVQTDSISVQDDEHSHFAHETSVSVAEDFSHP